VAAPREDADVVTSSDAYARRFGGAVGSYFLERQSAAVLELVRPWPGARVLDVGGGHGQVTGPLVAAGYAVTVLGSETATGRPVAEGEDRARAEHSCNLGDHGRFVHVAHRVLAPRGPD